MNPLADQRPPRHRLVAMVGCIPLAVFAAIFVITDPIRACGPYLSFRAYLTRSFWLPMYYTIGLLLPAKIPTGNAPYAGFAGQDVPPALAGLRAAYRPLATTTRLNQPQSVLDEASQAAARALAPGVLTGSGLEEARLIDCKLMLRLAEDNLEALDSAIRKLEEFIASAKNPVFVSEARGWLARGYYLQKDYVRAARIYLDETEAADSPLSRDTLVTSLRWVYSIGQGQLWDRAEEFFDTPRHALFLVNLVTNQSPYGLFDDLSRRMQQERGSKVLALLQEHPELFKSGADSDALVMALMRTSLHLGDTTATLKYGAAVPKSGALRQNPEFNWMEAIARFVRRDYAGAEGPLLRMLNAPSASGEDRVTAAQALIGVYLKTQRKVEALHAAFIQQAVPLERDHWPDVDSPRMQWCFFGLDLDLPYLLDAGLTDEELREYLRKYPTTVGESSVFSWGQQSLLSDLQIVRYSLAVRYARHEEYAEAAKIFKEIGIPERAGRMQALAELLARSRNAALPPSERRAALFDYGVMIASNPERVYFNDLLWRGMQRSVFLLQYGTEYGAGSPRIQPGLTRAERQSILSADRRLRDEQEERWKAFHVFEQVAREAGHSDIGNMAAKQIIECLGRINTGRFGRAQEIAKAISTWKHWLKQK